MDDSNATLWAAGLAAVLSAVSLGVNFWFERRRHEEARKQELTKWMREQLHGVAIQFLDSAFSISGRCGDARSARLAGMPLEETQGILDRVHRSHTTMRDALTRLRLIAPADVIRVAEQVHDSHHDVINVAFGHKPPSDDEVWGGVKDAGKRDREQFLTVLRQPLGLDPHGATIAAQARSNWRVPADQVDGAPIA
jgi:hypothetical protein